MQYSRVAIALAGALALVTAVSAAEDTPQLEPGARVRVESATAQERVVGQLLGLNEKSLNLQVEDEEEPRLLLREDITALAVSGGRRSRGRGALIGAGTGIALGALIGLAAGDDPEDVWIGFSAGEKALGAGVLLGSIGALIGLAVSPGERWENVPLDDVRVSLGPVPGRGVGVFVTVAF